MDNGFRQRERRGAQSGASDDEARVLVERLRAGSIKDSQLLVMCAAGLEPACLALNLNREQATSRIVGLLPAPSRDLFEPIVEQITLVWALNQQLGWGFTSSHFATANLPTTSSNDTPHTLCAVTLVPYLDTVEDTFEGLWRAIQARHGNTYRTSDLKADAEHLKLLDSIVHPGKCLRWETINMAANWDQEDGIAPRDVRNTQSPHAGILAAAAIHKNWLGAMDGRTVPFVWVAGYQTRSQRADSWHLVPRLSDGQGARRAGLYRNRDDLRSKDYAVPVMLG